MNIRSALFVVALMAIMLAACSSHKLAEYNLRDANIAARTFMPPRANVFTDFSVDIDPKNLVSTALSVGTTIARESQAMEARVRLDSAMSQVDVPGIIEEEVLFQAAEMLNFRPVNEVNAADFVFNVDMDHYGISASGWEIGTYFVIEAKVELIDNASSRRIWKSKVEAKEPLSPRIFGLNHSVENVMDAMALSQLTVDEMATGMHYLANFTADVISEKLYKDYIKSRD